MEIPILELVAQKKAVGSLHRGREGDAMLTAEGIVAKKKVVRSMHVLRVEAGGQPGLMEVSIRVRVEGEQRAEVEHARAVGGKGVEKRWGRENVERGHGEVRNGRRGE